MTKQVAKIGADKMTDVNGLLTMKKIKNVYSSLSVQVSTLNNAPHAYQVKNIVEMIQVS